MIITVLVLIMILVATGLFYEYGWRGAGFRMVTHPNYLKIHSVREENQRIIIEGTTQLNIGSFQGSVVEYNAGILYVGVRYSLFGDDTDFKVSYPEEDGPVQRVVLKKYDDEKTIWLRAWKEQVEQ